MASMYKCATCPKTFTNKGNFNKHSVACIGKTATCDICNRVLSCKSALTSHKRRVHPVEPRVPKVFSCEICMLELPTNGSLHAHMKTDHMDVYKPQHVCNTCGKDYASSKLLKEHIVTHAKTRESYPCRVCNLNFSKPYGLTRHMRSHTKQHNNFSCNLCDYATYRSDSLRSHMHNAHSDVRPYPCEECKMAFKLQATLNIHVKTVHKGIKDYKCNVCESEFKSSLGLAKHMATAHSDVRNYHCPDCNASFKTKNILQNHVNYVHSDRRDCVCSICNMAFQRKTNLDAHIRNKHTAKQFQCEECQQWFITKYTLQEHINKIHLESNLLECHICHKQYVSNSKLNAHMITHDDANRKFQCPHCPLACFYQTSLQKHIDIVHLNIKKYECTHENCGSRFGSSGELKVHVRTWHSEQGILNQKKKEKRVAEVLDNHELAYHREYQINFKCINGTQKYARIDFLLILHGIVCLLEVDENQHKDYMQMCELTRVSQVYEMFTMNGNTMPVLFIRYNPDEYKVNNKKKIFNKKDREQRLIEYLEKDIKEMVDRKTIKPLSMTYMYYDVYQYNDKTFLQVHGEDDYYNEMKKICNEPIF